MSTAEARWDSLVQELAVAQRTGELLDIPAAEHLPQDAAAGYCVQDGTIARLGQVPRAWKLGATMKAAQANFGLSEPFSGPVLEGRVLPSPTTVDVSGYACHVFEPEIAITLGKDIEGPIDPDAARVAIASYHPAIELINFRYRAGRSLNAIGMITDCGANGAMVLGPPTPASEFDYWTATLDTRVNSKTIAGRMAVPPETEIGELLAWFSGHVTARGYALRKGDVITTGSQAGILEYAPGDLVEADFGDLGVASFQS